MRRRKSPPKRDGIPFTHDFGEQSVGNSDANLGTLRLPETYNVTLRILHADGEPAPSAEPGIAAATGSVRPSKIRLTRDGYLKLTDTDYTGVELGGLVLLSAEFTETGAKYEKPFNITEPTDLVVQAGTGFREASATTESTPTTTSEEPSTTASNEEPTTPRRTTSGTDGTTTARESSTATTAQNATRSRRRGFFSNESDDEESVRFLEDPHVLTVGGFALSIGESSINS